VINLTIYLDFWVLMPSCVHIEIATLAIETIHPSQRPPMLLPLETGIESEACEVKAVFDSNAPFACVTR
jgi:hypothetical protein